MTRPEHANREAIDRLQRLLEELHADPSTAREREAIREIGYEIAIAIREVGALLVDAGWGHADTDGRPAARATETE